VREVISAFTLRVCRFERTPECHYRTHTIITIAALRPATD
jgi:hypothetical protein